MTKVSRKPRTVDGNKTKAPKRSKGANANLLEPIRSYFDLDGILKG